MGLHVRNLAGRSELQNIVTDRDRLKGHQLIGIKRIKCGMLRSLLSLTKCLRILVKLFKEFNIQTRVMLRIIFNKINNLQFYQTVGMRLALKEN